MCNFKSALLIPRFPSSDGFDLFHREGVDSHTELMELANINPNDAQVRVAKLELIPTENPSDVNKWKFFLDELRQPDWLDNAMLADAEYELRQICSRYISKDGECTVIDTGASKQWLLNGERHREDGPALELSNGEKYWYLHGKVHRTDGPAMEFPDGTKKWCLNGEYHRTDGPAFEWANGDKYWYNNGKMHREDGPAIEHEDGRKHWYINGVYLTEEEFNQR
mgnify:FL=1